MSQQSTKTHGDQAHLLRAIEHAITYDRMAAPRAVDMMPEYGSAILRFAEDDVAAVQEWAARIDAVVVHGADTYDRTMGAPWHEFGTRPSGKRGQLVGWAVDLWCVVNTALPAAPDPEPTPEPEPVEAEQEWLFTFGSGQQHDGRFVRIVGTYDSARARMLEVFGRAWCAQYDWRRFDEEGLPAKLTELPESEWPTGECPACQRLHFPWCPPHGGPGYTDAAVAVEVPSQRVGE